jgi:hypothetical protein
VKIAGPDEQELGKQSVSAIAETGAETFSQQAGPVQNAAHGIGIDPLRGAAFALD